MRKVGRLDRAGPQIIEGGPGPHAPEGVRCFFTEETLFNFGKAPHPVQDYDLTGRRN